MKSDNLDHLLDYWILLVGKELERIGNIALEPLGVTYRQAQVIGALTVFGEMSQTKLAERVQVEPSSVVRLVDRMERDGWITRQPSLTDRRVKLLQLTDQVKPIWTEVVKAGMVTRERAVKGISQARLNELNKTLSDIYNNLAEDDGSGLP
ncbi:MarR family winged helix-turn-helix transcriptional regulator [Thalassoglobus polymorphus]|uniref:Transcriptional regulator SlyA n=1 Tax=Thalassoglobus polymorphus TaxID=2527994 RepID=A0A517QTP2_9PLAN|nr:MarR family transcriptional regulator [Thalassoglobus polymorphus]QDT34948.1 Transcriptional regulator SlyA [Thalassoglobus polymorphus]